MCNFCKMISVVDHDCWDESEDEERLIMRSSKPKLSIDWHIEQAMGMLDARSCDVKLLLTTSAKWGIDVNIIDYLAVQVQKYLGHPPCRKRGDTTFAQRLTLPGTPNECEVGWISAGHKPKSPNAGRVCERDPGESNEPSLPLLFDISTTKEINSTTPWPGDGDGSIQNSGAAYQSTTSDAGENGTVSNKIICKLSRASDEGSGSETTACFDTANKEKAQTSVGLVNMDPSNPEELDATVVNSRVQRRNSSGSNGAQAITSSEETDHIPVEHQLTGSEFQHQRGIHFTLKLDHLRAARIYMTTDSAVGHGADPAAIPASGNTDEEFIFDSGAEAHVTGNFALLSRVTAVENGRGVVTASGHFMPALCSGSLIIDGFNVKDVLFVPGMTGTIFSVSKLDDLGYSSEFAGGECFVRDVTTNNLVGKGHRVSGLYKVDYLEIPR